MQTKLYNGKKVILIYWSLRDKEWKEIQGELESIDTKGGLMIYEPNDSSYYSFQEKLHRIYVDRDEMTIIHTYRPNKH